MSARMASVVFLLLSCSWAAGGNFQRATVTAMQTTECVMSRHSVMAALSGAGDTSRHESCSEYVLVSPTAIFRVQASKSAPLLLPAEEVGFHTGKGSLVVRRDDQQGDFEVRVVCMQLRNSSHQTCAVADGISGGAARASR